MPPPPAPRRFDRSLVEGPLLRAVWKLAWPAMRQNVIAGLQGIMDHALVGHFVGYAANAAIGVSMQIILVVITFIGSLYSGTAVLVARAAAIATVAANAIVGGAASAGFGARSGSPLPGAS